MDDKTEREMLEEATGWILKLENASEGSLLFDQFNAWLAQSEEHREAWESANNTWRILGAVRPASSEGIWGAAPSAADHSASTSLAAGAEIPAAARKPYRRPAAIAATCLAAALVIWIAGPALLLALRADYRTATAETELVQIDDGSTVELGGASAINTGTGTSGRRVTLLAGEAFFDVKSDPEQPFLVDAERLEIKTLGTAFNVRLSSVSTSVALLRGSIEVSMRDGGQPPAILVPGQLLVIDHSTGDIRIGDMAIDDIGSWRQGRTFLRNTTVEDAVELIRRYHDAWIVIPDRALAGRRVSGFFDLGDPDGALETLVRPFGGKVRSATPLVRVISRR